MNFATRTRLLQFAKTINLQNVYQHRNVSTLKRQKCPEFLIIRRNNSTRHDLLRAQMKNSRDADAIGLFGYVLLSMPVGAFFLGGWQIQRRKQKLALIEDLNSRVSHPPVELPLDLTELESMEYHPVKVRGKFLHDKEFLVGPRSLILKGAGVSEEAGGVLTPGRSNTGFYIVTPFQLADRDLTILVNRGWVPTQYKKNRREAKTQSNDIVEVTGVVRLNEPRPLFMPKNSPKAGSWLYRDVNAMSEMAGTAPVYIELVASETVRGGPVAGQTRIHLRNEHLAYIFTWYSLAAILGWMWHRQFIRKLPIA